MIKLTHFTIGEKSYAVLYLNTNQVKEGVECDVYSFVGDSTKDLAIVRVKAGFSTPRQKVMSGAKTIEGFISGEGNLQIVNDSGEVSDHLFEPGIEASPVEVSIGDTMQWRAATDFDLSFYEICTPPYEKGRFENL